MSDEEETLADGSTGGSPDGRGGDRVSNVRKRKMDTSEHEESLQSTLDGSSARDERSSGSKRRPVAAPGDLAAAREEYTKSLNQWMYQCYCWQWFRVLSCPPLLPPPTLILQQPPQANTYSTPSPPFPGRGRVYTIPTLWKRMAAELVDFGFLLIIKVMVTCITLDYFELIDYNSYDGSLLDDDFDPYQMAYKWSSEILIIEIIHRMIVIIFETLFLRSGRNANSPGGATPGKMMFGLKVISCSQVNELGNGAIQVISGEDIGFWRSLLRALIKNLSSIFFLPTSLTVFISNHNRAAYDYACKSIVVEEMAPGPARRDN